MGADQGSLGGKRFDGEQRQDPRGGSFAGNHFTGHGFAGDKAFGKSFKPRAPGAGAGSGNGFNGFADNKFAPKEGRSFSKPAGDFKSAAKPFAKSGFKPAGKTFAAKGPRKP
jgi:hypothetical protein